MPIEAPARNQARGKSKKSESFLSSLFSLMTRQCIFSAILFGAVYTLKAANLPFSAEVCRFIKSTVLTPVTLETAKDLINLL